MATAPTEPTGRFLVPGLEPGEYRVALVTHEPGVALALLRSVTLSESAPLATLTFTVPGAACAGEVRTAAGQPLPAEVLLLDAATGDVRCRTQADSHGRYRLLGIESEDCILLVTAAGYAADERTEIDRSVRRGETLLHVLEPEARIAVLVVDDASHALAGAQIRCIDREGMPRTARSVLEGTVFPRLRGGRWTLSATYAGYLPATPVECAVSPGETRRETLVLFRPAALDVEVVDAEGTELANVVVELRPWAAGTAAAGPSRSETTGREGRTRFEGLRAGSYTVSTTGAEPALVEVSPGVTSACTLTVGEH